MINSFCEHCKHSVTFDHLPSSFHLVLQQGQQLSTLQSSPREFKTLQESTTVGTSKIALNEQTQGPETTTLGPVFHGTAMKLAQKALFGKVDDTPTVLLHKNKEN